MFSPNLFELVSIYLKLSPIGDNDIAPELPVGDEIFADRVKFCILFLFFLSLHFIFHCFNENPPLFEFLTLVVALVCILSYSA